MIDFKICKFGTDMLLKSALAMEKQSVSLTTHSLSLMLSKIEDPRDEEKVFYPITEIFFLLITASLSGCNELTEIQEFGQQKISWLRGYYPFSKGIPSHDTLGRVLALVNKKSFEQLFTEWVVEQFHLPEGELVNFDGKRLASSADRADQSKSRSQGGRYAEIIVHAFAAGAGIALAQRNVTEKINELEGADHLLDALDLKGCCVSGDSNFCGRDLMAKIISKKADYLLSLKGKSMRLFTAVKQAMTDPKIEKDSFVTEEKGHGRHEKREYYSIPAATLPELEIKEYVGIAQVIQVKRSRITMRSGKHEEETHFYITSLKKPIKDLAGKIRAHWHIENKLHYVLDVLFEEDDSRLRTKNAATNLSLVRKISLNLIRQIKEKGNLKAHRLRCAFSDDYRSDILKSIMR